MNNPNPFSNVDLSQISAEQLIQEIQKMTVRLIVVSDLLGRIYERGKETPVEKTNGENIE